MGFILVLALATLAACTQAHATYGSRSMVAAPIKTYSGRGVGLAVLPVRDNSYLDATTRLGNKYDAGRLVQEAVYNPRRVGMNSGYVGSRGMDMLGHGHGSHVDLNQGLGFRDQCNCHVGEVCRKDRNGRNYCQASSNVGLRSRVRQGSLSSRLGGHTSDCMYLEYPSDCVRSPSRNTITRYTFYEGRCRRFTSSRIATTCQPRGDSSNIFRDLRECQMYCRV